MGLYNLLHKVSELLNEVVYKTFQLLKTHNNYIMLESEGDYTDNIKTFYDFLIENGLNKKYKLIWVVHNPSIYKKEDNVVFISRYMRGIKWKCNYYAAVSKVFIFSHPYWLTDWKKDQIVINTSHSVARLKGKDKNMKKKIFDFILCCSPYCRYVKMDGFNVNEEHALILGMPRIDLMYHHKDCAQLLLKQYADEKIILVMETFRKSKYWNDSKNDNSYGINVIRNYNELNKLDSFLNEIGYKMIVKIHHLQDMSFLKDTRLKNIVYLTDDILNSHEIQVNELLENADILLTDYSSVFYEFLIKDRPIGFIVSDIEDYTRGFMMKNPLDEMPGKKIYCFDDLVMFLSECNDGIDEYSEHRKIIKEKVFSYNDDKNCERLLNWIEKNIQKETN